MVLKSKITLLNLTDAERAEKLYRQYVDLLPQKRLLASDREAAEKEDDSEKLERLEVLYDQNFNRCFDIRAEIENLPPSMNSVAAVALIGSICDIGGDACADCLDCAVLDHIRGQLSGMIRDHVDQLLNTVRANPFTRMSAMPFYA